MYVAALEASPFFIVIIVFFFFRNPGVSVEGARFLIDLAPIGHPYKQSLCRRDARGCALESRASDRSPHKVRVALWPRRLELARRTL